MMLRRIVIRAAVTWTVGIVLYVWTDARHLAFVLFAIGGLLLLTGLISPRSFRALERGCALLGHWAATFVTWVLLVPFFYLVFTPVRLIHRFTGKDPMQREFPTDKPTYWTPHKWKTDPENYHRLF